MANSINTNIAALTAQQNISVASNKATSSIARLSSGNRIVRASDDVAALSAGSSLRTNVTTLRRALINTSQGSSLLQVADGALAQVTEILQRQKAIAVQAGGGSLTDTERSFLNQEFTNLTSEIDRLVENTNFNGVKLLDGSLSDASVGSAVTDQGSKATATLTFSDNVDDGETVIINGVTLTGETNIADVGAGEFFIGASIAETVQNLANTLNNIETNSNFTAANKLLLSEATYEAQGNSLKITARTGGELGSQFTVSTAGTATDTLAEGGIGGAYGEAYITVFATGFASATAEISSTTAAAALPFDADENVTATIDGVAYTIFTGTGSAYSLNDLVNGINANTDNTGIAADLVYDRATETYNVRLSHGLYIDATGDVTVASTNYSNGTYALNAATTTAQQAVFGLENGADDGVGFGSIQSSGTVGDTLLTGLAQTEARVVISFPEIADTDISNSTNFGTQTYITVGGQDFVFTTTAEAGRAANEITIGATLEETLNNAVNVINSFEGLGATNYVLDQVNVVRDGNTLVFESKDARNVTTIAGGGATVAINRLASTTNSGNLNNSDTGAIDVLGISNSDFIGKISGFEADYVSSNKVDLSVKIGEFTYTARSVTTNVTSNTTVRFYSDEVGAENGGYFDLEFAANKGDTVTNATQADAFANRINTAFSSLNFFQTRVVDSYAGNSAISTEGVGVTGSLVGTSVNVQLESFDKLSIGDISVKAPTGSLTNGEISLSINGTTFKSASNIGTTLGANTTIRLTSVENADEYLEFNTGNTEIDFDTTAKAKAFQDALVVAFGGADGANKETLKFQVGTTASDTLEVSISGVSTNSLFEGKSINVLTQAAAFEASNVLDVAIKAVTSVRAEVGALQSRFDFASANIQSSLQNQDAARGTLLDADVAEESTAYATSQVLIQAGISVLAQANQLPQNLLKLIG